MIISVPQSGAPCNILSREMRMIMRRREDKLKTKGKELVNDLKADGPVTKNTTGNPLHCNGLKSCGTCKVPLLKKPHAQVCLKFASEQLNDQRVLGRKCRGQMKPKVFGILAKLIRRKITIIISLFYLCMCNHTLLPKKAFQEDKSDF